MPSIKTIAFLLTLFFLTSCAGTSKHNSFRTYPVRNKLNLSAAMVINEQFEKQTYQANIFIRCCERSKEKVINGESFANIKLGKINRKFYKEAFSYLFKTLDVYSDINKINNRGKYDYILLPNIIIKTTYDKNKADSRDIPSDVSKFSKYMKFGGLQKNYFSISALVECRLQVINPKTGNIIEDLTAKTGASGKTYAMFCNRDFELENTYSDLIYAARKIAFTKLLKKADQKFLQLIK